MGYLPSLDAASLEQKIWQFCYQSHNLTSTIQKKQVCVTEFPKLPELHAGNRDHVHLWTVTVVPGTRWNIDLAKKQDDSGISFPRITWIDGGRREGWIDAKETRSRCSQTLGFSGEILEPIAMTSPGSLLKCTPDLLTHNLHLTGCPDSESAARPWRGQEGAEVDQLIDMRVESQS